MQGCHLRIRYSHIFSDIQATSRFVSNIPFTSAALPGHDTLRINGDIERSLPLCILERSSTIQLAQSYMSIHPTSDLGRYRTFALLAPLLD